MSKASDYRVVIEPLDADLGGGFVAYVPDLPGCLADGETPREALENAYDAVECWLEAALEQGRAVPEPTASAQTA